MNLPLCEIDETTLAGILLSLVISHKPTNHRYDSPNEATSYQNKNDVHGSPSTPCT